MEIHKISSSNSGILHRKKTVGLVLVLVLIAIAVLLVATYKVVEKKHDEVLLLEKSRITNRLVQRTTEFDRLVKSYVSEGDRLVSSDLFRLYATEVASADGDLTSFVVSANPVQDQGDLTLLLEQLPLMQNMLREFAIYAGFLNARIFSQQGSAYLDTDINLPPVTEDQRKFVIETLKTGKVQYAPLRKSQHGMELDLLLPIFPPEGGEEDGDAIGVLLMTRQVTGVLTSFLSDVSSSNKGEKTYLIQQYGDQYTQVTPWTVQGFTQIEDKLVGDLQEKFSFSKRQSVNNEAIEVFSIGKTTIGGWVIVQENDVRIVLGPVNEFSKALYAICWLGIFAVLLVISLGWWIMSGLQSRKEAEILAEQAQVIEKQRQFIDSINETIDDFIILTDLDGKYLYVNDSFTDAVDRSRDSVVGLDDVAIFGFGTAKRLAESNEKVIAAKEKVVVNEDVFLQSKRYNFQISKIPYLNSKGECVGVVQVYRDNTKIVAMQERAQKLNRQTVSALSATIEAVDPYLADHTRQMALYADKMAQTIGYEEGDRAELVMAANLSQIGKAFIPKDILSKPGKLTEEELALVQGHVDHSIKILREIDVPESVLDMIAQMNENLDGSGYPKKLTKDEIIPSARLLGVLNVFCALVSPRSYRSALEESEALEIINKTPERYDQDAIAHLKDVLRNNTSATTNKE